MDRMSENWSDRDASLGNNSEYRTPGDRVAMVEKGPRNSAGALGLGSKVSNWAGPPQSQTKITDFALPFTGPAIARAFKRSAQCKPSTDDAPTCRTLLRECFPIWMDPRLKMFSTPVDHRSGIILGGNFLVNLDGFQKSFFRFTPFVFCNRILSHPP